VHDLKGCRVGVWLDNPLVRTDREMMSVLRALVDAIADGGAEVVERLRPPRPFYEMQDVYVRMLLGTLSAGFTDEEYADLVKEARATSTGSAVQLAAAVTQSYREWLATEERRAQIEAGWPSLFEKVDVVVAPVTPLAAFPHTIVGTPAERVLVIDGRDVPYFGHLVWTNLASLARLPATVVPAGRTAAGLPVGVQIIGPRFGDRTTLAFARLLEPVVGGFVPPCFWKSAA
jgi:amidase